MKILSVNSIRPYTLNVKHPRTSFVGRLGAEDVTSPDTFITQRKILTQETAFFREPDTLEFVRDYVNKTFDGKNKVNVVVGGCSSGEEAWTLKMLLGDKVNVLGFDLGEGAIGKAKSGNYSISKARNEEDSEYYSAYGDSYLAFGKPATEKESEYKKLFEEYFEPADIDTNKKPVSFFKKLTPLLPSKSKNFRVKDDKAGECGFIQGDILKLDKFIEPNSVDVLTFRNALYHLTTTRENQNTHIPRPNEEIKPMLDELFGKIHKVLSKDGIFVLGKFMYDHLRSFEQDGSGIGEIIYSLLTKHGFKPAFVEDEKTSVWQKVGG